MSFFLRRVLLTQNNEPHCEIYLHRIDIHPETPNTQPCCTSHAGNENIFRNDLPKETCNSGRYTIINPGVDRNNHFARKRKRIKKKEKKIGVSVSARDPSAGIERACICMVFARPVRYRRPSDSAVSVRGIKKVGVSSPLESVSLESRGTIFRRRGVKRGFFTLRRCCILASSAAPRATGSRLVKVNIYEDANHRHRSSRLVNQLRRRGFVFTSEGQPSSLYCQP